MKELNKKQKTAMNAMFLDTIEKATAYRKLVIVLKDLVNAKHTKDCGNTSIHSQHTENQVWYNAIVLPQDLGEMESPEFNLTTSEKMKAFCGTKRMKEKKYL